MVKCRYCSSETEQDGTDTIVCPWCHREFNMDSKEFPDRQEIYLARDMANQERAKQRELYELKHPKRHWPDQIHLKDPEVKIVNGIKITRLRLDSIYVQRLKQPKSLFEKVSHAANIILTNAKGNRMFYSHVDIPNLKCSIILESVYLGGLTVGYHELTDQLYIRSRGGCWQKFTLEEENVAR